MQYEPVIGLEIHAELQTRSKMFCRCEVVGPLSTEPNTAVCPVCAGMPGTLPVVNQRAVEYALRVALALNCTVNPKSIFARKNYFYPDLPKGYQISQYDQPLAVNGKLRIHTQEGEQVIRIRRIHLEEDTGKLTHIDGATLVDLNRAGIPLLEIVSEPDIHTIDALRNYADSVRSILRYLQVNSGDMEKGVIRFESNISMRPNGSNELNTRVEIKNLNSFRALERATAFEIERQSALLEDGQEIDQETLGWNEDQETTFTQRSKEDAHDYRYFPEPDLPPLLIDESWLERIRAELPELPQERADRFQKQYGLSAYNANLLTSDRAVANYFESALKAGGGSTDPKATANWITGELFGLMNQADMTVADLKISPDALVELVMLVSAGEINQSTAKAVLAEMFASGTGASDIVDNRGLKQVSDRVVIAELVQQVLAENQDAVASLKSGKESAFNRLFGQVMREAGGKANPSVVREELEKGLKA